MLRKRFRIKTAILAVFLLLPLILPFILKAQEATLPLSKEETADLQKELEAIQAEIDQYEAQLTTVQSEKNTLNKKISQLKIQQSKIALQIKQTNLAVKKTESELLTVQNSIKERNQRLAGLKVQVADLIRLIDKKDHYSLLAIFVANKGLGDFFNELAAYKNITSGLNVLVAEVKKETLALEGDQVQLEDQKLDQKNLVAIANLQNRELDQNLNERKTLLAETKAKESNYQAILSDKQKKAREIKNRIYDLLGVSREVTFGEAVKIAAWAQVQTGVRTAFLLAILTQESNLGRNVGTCNRPGDPPEKSWKVIMKPERDQEPFKTITAELGMDPDITPVSCPMKDKNGKQLGWGGAMGPAQFIPSTWIGYRAKVTVITGKSANPWDIRDAFLAAAILLKANGASSQSGEWAAAMKYFSGSTNAKYSFYADNVLAIAKKYQQDIEDLNAD